MSILGGILKLAGMRTASLFVPHSLEMPLAGLEPATATELKKRSIPLSYRGNLRIDSIII